MDDYTWKKIEARIKDLPTLPTVATRIFEVTNDPDASVEELREIIAMDQVVAGRILRAVNSAYYGFPRQIDTLSKAIVILGFNNVRSLALSVSIMEMFSRKNTQGLNLQELWKHAVGTAFCSRSLAKMSHPRDIEKLFIAGLLHDIGFVAINQCYPESYISLMKDVRKTGKPIYTLEKELFGFTHSDVGSFIAEKWLLPKGLSRAIGLHHNPEKATPEECIFVYTIHIADFLCKKYNFGDIGDNKYSPPGVLYRPALDMYGISDKGICQNDLRDQLDNDFSEAGTFLGIFD